MTEEEANAVAEALAAETWQSGGDTWLVLKTRQDGRVVVISDEAVCEYESEKEAQRGLPSASIRLN